MIHSLEKIRRLVFAIALITGGMACAEDLSVSKEVVKEDLFAPQNISKISRAYGHFIAKSLDSPIIKLNIDDVIAGMQSAKQGEAAPMTEQEYEELLSRMHESAFKDMAERNLKEAHAFFAKPLTENVVVVEKGKLHMLVVQPGQQDGPVVTEEVLPSFHYKGHYLDGSVFGSSYESGEPVSVHLKSVIPGFRLGVMGMKIGEKRTLFIHPDLGYGTSGQLLPNAVMVFDVELVKIDPLPKDQPQEELIEDDSADEGESS